MSKLNFFHHKDIIQGYDFVKDFHDLETNNDLNGDYYYLPNDQTNSQDNFLNNLSKDGLSLFKNYNNFFRVFKYFVIFLIFILIIFLIIFLLFCFLVKKNDNKLNMRRNQRI